MPIHAVVVFTLGYDFLFKFILGSTLRYTVDRLGSKIEELFPCLVRKLSVILTALQYKPQ